MSVTYRWDNAQKSIVHYQFTDNWTWDEFYPVLDQVNIEMQTLNHAVSVILDMSQSKAIPANTVSQFSKIARLGRERPGLRAVVTANTFVVSLYRIFIKVNHRVQDRFVLCNTLEEAREKIYAYQQRQL
jgi:hypothetical protein